MSDDPKQRILDAAFAEFSANGKAGARMQAIAERAQVNQAMLNYYFKSKDDLYHEVIRQSVIECGHEMSLPQQMDREGWRQAVLEHVERDLRFWAEHTDLLRLVMHDLLAGGEGMKLAMQRAMERPQSQRLFNEITASGCFRDRDQRQVFLHLAPLVLFTRLFMPTVEALWPGSMNERDFLEARIRAVREFLLHGIFSSGDSADSLDPSHA